MSDFSNGAAGEPRAHSGYIGNDPIEDFAQAAARRVDDPLGGSASARLDFEPSDLSEAVDERGRVRTAEVREARDAARAAGPDWVDGRSDPGLAELSIEELQDRLRQTAEAAFSDSNFSRTPGAERRGRELGI